MKSPLFSNRPWGVGITEEPHPRVFIEYHRFDNSIHNEHDIRLYIDGNFGTNEDKVGYAKELISILIKGEK